MKLSIVNTVKTFLISLGLLIASTVLFANIAIANPFSLGTAFLAQSDSAHSNSAELQPNTPPSPEATDKAAATSSTDSKATEKTAESAQNKQKTQSGGPYDMKAIEEFYKSLYGS